MARAPLPPWRGAARRSRRSHHAGGARRDDVATRARRLGRRRDRAAHLRSRGDARQALGARRAPGRRMTKLEGLNPDFRDVLLCFADGQVEFLIVGAYALGFHGAPRASGDIDLFVNPTRENARRVFDALIQFGAPVAAHGVSPADFERPGIVYQAGLPPRRIDVLTAISGVSFDEAWTSRVEAQIDMRSVFVIGREAFLKNKAACGRPKDLADAARLRRR